MLIIAHRGASGYEDENTLPAMQMAIEMGADAIEFDVFNVDGEIVVIHDRWSSRTTNGIKRLDHLDFNELRQLTTSKGLTVPTLWEVLQLIDGQCDVNIELKGADTVELTLNLIDKALNELNFRPNQFLLSSFNHHWLMDAKKRNPAILIGALTSSLPIGLAKFAVELDAYSINIDVDFVTQALIDDAHQHGLKVLVFTVNQTEDILDMVAYEVDGIFTNYPDKARNIIAPSEAAPLYV